MQLMFSRYIAACGLEKANFHALRHTFATRCIEAGFDVKTLSEVLGHTKTTLNRYVHSSYALKQQNNAKTQTYGPFVRSAVKKMVRELSNPRQLLTFLTSVRL